MAPGPEGDEPVRRLETFLTDAYAVFEVVAPTLIAYELQNVIHRKFPGEYGTDRSSRERIVSLMLAAVDLVPPDPPSLRRCAEIVERTRLSAYDAAYLELASRDEETDLATEDGPLRKAAMAELGAARVFSAATAHEGPA